MKNTYKLIGTCATQGAEKTEPFEVTDWGETPLIAMNNARRRMYEQGRDRILFTKILVDAGTHWQEIPMLKALELE